MGHLAGFECGSISNPDIALTPKVEYPGNTVRVAGGRQPSGKGGTHDLFESKALGLSGRQPGTQKAAQQEQPESFHKRTMILAASSWLLASCGALGSRLLALKSLYKAVFIGSQFTPNPTPWRSKLPNLNKFPDYQILPWFLWYYSESPVFHLRLMG